jgi:hypothetical protein
VVRQEEADEPETTDVAGTDPEGPLRLHGRVLQPGDRIDRWVYERELGSGGMARVLLVREADGSRLALKVLRANRLETGLPRFRREFHALSRLDHPNVVHVQGYGDLDGHPYIAMEYVDGPDLHEVIRGFRGLPDAERWVRCEQILVDLCRALAAIHRRGLVHRDLKPSNILLTRDGTCKLTDFGIVKDLGAGKEAELSTTLVGTWAYTSPEHISGERVDHRSDLYGLGVILFAMLTGKRPFVAENMTGYLEAHRKKPAPRASRVRPGVPPHLDDICARLLAKAPRDRFQSAREILYRLEADVPERMADAGWEPPLTGAREPLDTLFDAVAGLTDGRGRVALITAEDGLGKSRLLREIGDRARALGLPLHLLELREGDPVFTATMRLAHDLLAELGPERAEELDRTVRAWTDGGVLRGDTRYALYDGLRSALALLLDDGPRVLLLDDVHEAHPQEADLFRYLSRHLVGDGRPLLVVGAGRPGASVTRDAWRQGIDPLEITLGPLDEASVEAMVASFVGESHDAAALARRLHAESEGNPWFVTEFLRSLVASGLIAPGSETGHRLVVDPRDLAEGHLEIPPGIRQMLKRRLDGVQPGDRAVLDALAVAGRSTELDVLLDVLDEDEEIVLQRLDRLLASGLVRENRRTDLLAHEVVHRQLAEQVRRELATEHARALHRAFATALEGEGGADAEILEVIGRHWRLAGEAGRAFGCLVTAAHRLVERSLPEEAWRLTEHAGEVEVAARGALPGARFLALRTDLLQARVAALRHRGDWAKAAEVGRELVAHADDLGDERAGCDARVSLSHVLRRQGEGEAALDAAQQALATARRLHYRRGVAEALHALSGIAWGEGDAEQCEALADEGLLLCDGPALASQRAQLLMTRSVAQAHRGQIASAIQGTMEAEALFDELRMKPLRVIALANLSELQLWQGEADEAWSRADEATQTATVLGYPLGVVAALRARGMAATALGRWGEAHDDLKEALGSARTIGVQEEILAISVSLAALAIEESDLLNACRHGAAALKATEGRDPERYQPLLHALLARALAQTRREVAGTLLRAVDDALPTLPTPRRLQTLAAASWAWLALGEKARATEHANELIRSPASRGFRLLALEARAVLAATTAGEEARRHRRIGAELAREFTDALPRSTSEEVRRRPMFRRFDEGG